MLKWHVARSQTLLAALNIYLLMSYKNVNVPKQYSREIYAWKGNKIGRYIRNKAKIAKIKQQRFENMFCFAYSMNM